MPQNAPQTRWWQPKSTKTKMRQEAAGMISNTHAIHFEVALSYISANAHGYNSVGSRLY